MLNRLKKVSVVNLIVSVVFLGCWYFLYANVRLGGDDYMYAAFSNDAFASAWSFYFTQNGRILINFLETLLMKFDRYAFVVINPLLMVALAILISKLICMLSGKSNRYIYAFTLATTAAIDVMLAQEVYYWLSGSATYLFSAVLFVMALISFLYLKQNPEISMKKKALLIAVCVFCTLSMEQFALISTGFIFVSLVYEFIHTKRVKNPHIVLFVLCALLALATVFAPANLSRLNLHSSDSEGFSAASLVHALMDAIFVNYYSSSALRFVALVSVLALVLFIKRGKKFLSIISGIELFIAVLILVLRIDKFIVSAFGLALFFVLIISVLIVAADSRETAVHTVSLMILAYMSQVFMLIDGLHGNRFYRISYTVILTYIILAVYLASKIDDIRVMILAVSALVMFVNLYVGLVLLVVSLILLAFIKNQKVNLPVFCAIAVIGVCLSLIPNALKLVPYARLVDYNEAQLRSGNMNIVVHNVRETDMEILYYCNYLVRVTDKFYKVKDGYFYQGPYYEYKGNAYRNYYGLNDDQTVKIEYIEGDISEFLESVGY